MKKIITSTILLTVLFILSGCSSHHESATRDILFPPSQPGTYKVMTYNIRADTILDGLNKWFWRKQGVYDLLAENAADVVGLQEANPSQLNQIKQVLTEYECYAVGRDDGLKKGESCPIFYRKDRFALLDSGTFWFSDTPRTPGSKDWGNIMPRICTWVHLREHGQEKGFYVYNMHLACFSQNARSKSARMLAREVSWRRTKDPFVAIGDYNMELSNPAMMYLMKFGYDTPYPKMVDAWMSANPGYSGVGTRRCWWGTVEGPKIDHIQTSEDFIALDAMIDDRKKYGRYSSDHYPVIAKISMTSDKQVSQLNTKPFQYTNVVLSE